MFIDWKDLGMQRSVFCADEDWESVCVVDVWKSTIVQDEDFVFVLFTFLYWFEGVCKACE